ncbi:four helix bundle protein [Aerosakkonemataceae cyanobacterium BLCC-F50]|uniref:Four helix bundle protein n=1 Tax=Floridaenema flaviceps BLCC-F50 TaxID=3153642 RepID=A0ABV4Y3L8_9CYAN
MERPDFEKLKVYQLSESLADAIWQIVEGWHRIAQDTVGKQIIRAADSIGANIAEGRGRYNFSDNRRFVRMARGSLNETRHWLRRAYRRNLLTTEQVNQLKPIIDELSPKINAYLKYLDNAVKQQRGNND